MTQLRKKRGGSGCYVVLTDQSSFHVLFASFILTSQKEKRKLTCSGKE